MVLLITLHCVKTGMDNMRTNKPTLDAIPIFATDIKFVTKSLSAFKVSKHLELQ